MMKQQVDKIKYNFQNYCTSDRWASYFHQIDELLKAEPESVLEVGTGDKVVASYLKNNTSIEYRSLDIAEDLSPDIVGSVDKMPCGNKSFDVVCAFEVLEHLPFDKFLFCLKELGRVAEKKVIISLPHWGRHFSLGFRLPYFGKISWQYKMSCFPIAHRFNGEHYWEIGKKEYPLERIIRAIKDSGFRLEGHFIPFDSPYHHFFVLSVAED